MEIQPDGSQRPMPLSEQAKAEGRPDSVIGTNVFILFDTAANYMYRGFVYASDAIAGLYSRAGPSRFGGGLHLQPQSDARGCSHERTQRCGGGTAQRGGGCDDSALYNGLLLTLRDAARVPGRKVVIVFSNGPDNASMVALRRRARGGRRRGHSYLCNLDPRSYKGSRILERVQADLTSGTGGKSYFCQDLAETDGGVRRRCREDLGNSYTVTYYPQPNPNEGFRKVSVEILSDAAKKYRRQVRPGYRPHGGF